MASNTQSMKGTETAATTTNSDSAQEIRVVDTVDHRSSAGQGEEERTKENIQITHQSLPISTTSGGGGAAGESGGGTEKGILAGAAEAVANTVRSAKEAIVTPK